MSNNSKLIKRLLKLSPTTTFLLIVVGLFIVVLLNEASNYKAKVKSIEQTVTQQLQQVEESEE